MNHTHIVVLNNTTKEQQLFRASDGIRLGSCKEILVVYGDNPNKAEGRSFIDHEHAQRYLREEVAMLDLKTRGIEGKPVLEIRDAEALILQPGETLAMPGSVRRMN